MSSAVAKIHPLTKETIAPKTCFGLMHRGKYSDIGNTFHKFFSALNEKEASGSGDNCGGCGASTMGGKVLGLYLDNPETTKPEDLRSYAALEVVSGDDAGKNEFPTDWEKVEVGGGVAAVMTVNGSYSQLGNAWANFGKRVMEEGWKFSTNPEHVSQEMYVEMDKDETKNVTKLIMFLDEEE